MNHEMLLSMANSEYMNEQQLSFFKTLLLDQSEVAHEAVKTTRETLSGLGNAADEVDQATIEEERQNLTRALTRLNSQIVAAQYSLKSVAEGEYGWCEESGQAIGIKRLLAQPTARYCATVQSERELKGKHYAFS